MKKKFLAALFAVVAVLGLVGVVSASPPATPTTNITVTLEPSKLVLEKVTMYDVDPSVSQGSADDVDVWIVKSIGTYAGKVDIPATYPYTDPDTDETVYLDVVAIGAINSSMTITEYPAFRESFISGVTIPETVIKIGRQAFAGSHSLTSVEIPKNVTEIGEQAFLSCDNLGTLTFPDNLKADGSSNSTLTIMRRAFEGCGLTTVDLPQHDTYIGDRAFYDCDKLTTVLIWNAKGFSSPPAAANATWRSFAFADCNNLKTIIISGSVTNIPNDAFDIPASVPANPKDVPVFHYWKQGDNLEDDLFDTAPLPGTVEIHPLYMMEKTEIASTCEKPGESYRNIKCSVSACSNIPNTVNRKQTLPLSDHTPFEPANKDNDLDYQGQLSAWKTEYDYKICESFTWDYDTKCTRCSADVTVEEEFVSQTPHAWDLSKETIDRLLATPSSGMKLDTYPDKFFFSEILPDDVLRENPELGDIEIDLKLPTCKKDDDGYIKWIATCTYECGTKKDDMEVKLLSDYATTGRHTFHKGYTETEVEIPATCLYEGINVEYIVCDGGHGEKKPCTTPNDDGKTCKELLNDAKTKITPLETAAKSYAKDPNTTVTEADLATLREKAIDAVREYRIHVLAKHTPIGDTEYDDYEKTKECVKSITPLSQLEEGKHTSPDDYLKTLDGPYYTNPTQDGDYYCTEGGWIVTNTRCAYCGKPHKDEEKVDPHKHTLLNEHYKEIDATCTERAKITYLPGAVCLDPNCAWKDPITESYDEYDPTSKPKGHSWGDFEPDGGTMPEPNDNCIEKKVEGKLTCTECGADYEKETGEKATKTIPGKSEHTWEWVPNADGKTETQVCKVKGCGKTGQTRDIVTSTPSTPTEPEPEPEPGPSGPSTPTPDPDATYTISVSYGSGGTASASASSAKAGTRISVSVSPNSGYKVDMVRVTGSTYGTTLSGGSYYFTMPAENVKIVATFSQVASSSKWPSSSGSSSSGSSSSSSQTVIQSIPQASASGQLFSDVPAAHWAAGEINWANQMGYMNGTSGGGFNPNGNITHQQLWMILARLTGNNPSNMADAKRWAVNGGFADGSAPEGPINRHQLVTALYRCAHLMGSSNRNTATLAGFPDSRLVPIVAREPFAWAVANGIIGGNADGRLDPNGTLTRAQFAVILYRFSQRV